MKLNISYPATGLQKCITIEDDKKLVALYDKRLSHEVNGADLGEEFAGYTFKITGGNDKQGFPMKQGVLTNSRVRLLLKQGSSCYRPRTAGERKRKSVRGCIVSSDLSVLHLVVTQKGEKDIPGLTDDTKPRRLGPKRATRIRKLFNLEKDDDVRAFVIKRKITKGDKTYTKAPKIQRLVTPQRLQRKRKWYAEQRRRIEKSKATADAYDAVVALRLKEQKERKAQRKASRRTSHVSNTQ
ncbi:40S ribosomal protein S6 [Plasmodiophora brassicae]|uniref:40S ribosomal protein S6 n=1 Tax=Plasmodiophora brassicae TaxID=37360 RepID=A0A0G4IY60_PLABS|nr:hypothetical protein PBRA_007891 [Plasmodiophora brassicae]SPQ98963.1 unnamed protein product [Plasmodiophora brassicae]